MKRTIPLTALILSVIGLLLALKLTFGQYGYFFGDYDEACRISEDVDCNAVYGETDYSMVEFEAAGEQYQIPISLIGTLTYIMLLLFFMWSLLISKEMHGATLLGPFLISVISLAVSCYMAYISAFVIDVFCPYCMGLYLVNLALFILLLIGMIKSGKMGWVAPWIGPWYFDQKAAWQFYLVPILIFAITALLAVPVNTWILEYKSQQLKLSHERYEFDLTGSPSLGTNELGIELIVFSDFECGHCRKLHEDLHEVMAHYDYNIKLYYKFLPLDQKCNSNLNRPFHLRACDAAFASYAAHLQGKFWEYADAIYEQEEQARQEFQQWAMNNPNLPLNQYQGYILRLQEIARSLNLDMNEFMHNFHNPTTYRIIKRDIEEARQIDVSGTPTLFVNGYRVVKGRKNVESVINLIEMFINNEPLPFIHQEEE